MNKLYLRYLLIAFFASSPIIHAQWFYETGFSSNTFEDYTATGSLPSTTINTTITPTKGLRDLSFNIGYLFSFPGKNTLEANVRPPFFRLGTSLGFDQVNVRTNAVINGFAFPTNYALAQLQGRVGLHLTPFVFYSDKSGVRTPTFLINFHGGAAYNHFTSAIRQGNNTSVDLLNDSNAFKQNYFSFQYGAGFQLFLTKSTQLYARYTIDNSEKFVENSVVAGQQVKETYRVRKNKVTLGVLVDFRLINKRKKQQEDKLSELETKFEEVSSSLDAQANAHPHDSLVSSVAQLEVEVEKIKENLQPKINESSMTTRIHEKGVRYFPEFVEVRFPKNSSYFNQALYGPMLRKLATFLMQNPNLKIHLVGYTDTTGQSTYNIMLSKKRANRVRDFIVNQYGIAANRILAEGRGETDEFSISDTANNRRTEIIIIE